MASALNVVFDILLDYLSGDFLPKIKHKAKGRGLKRLKFELAKYQMPDIRSGQPAFCFFKATLIGVY
jgi:hypothetical protein